MARKKYWDEPWKPYSPKQNEDKPSPAGKGLCIAYTLLRCVGIKQNNLMKPSSCLYRRSRRDSKQRRVTTLALGDFDNTSSYYIHILCLYGLSKVWRTTRNTCILESHVRTCVGPLLSSGTVSVKALSKLSRKSLVLASQAAWSPTRWCLDTSLPSYILTPAILIGFPWAKYGKWSCRIVTAKGIPVVLLTNAAHSGGNSWRKLKSNPRLDCSPCAKTSSRAFFTLEYSTLLRAVYRICRMTSE